MFRVGRGGGLNDKAGCPHVVCRSLHGQRLTCTVEVALRCIVIAVFSVFEYVVRLWMCNRENKAENTIYEYYSVSENGDVRVNRWCGMRCLKEGHIDSTELWIYDIRRL
jgi:hypothetical protein